MQHTQPGFRPEIYAIDFGTTNSLLAAANCSGIHGPIALDPQARDGSLFRSVIYFGDATRCHYGADALGEYVAQGMQGRLIRSMKRFLPERGFVMTRIGNRSYRLEELVGAFLRTMKKRADAFFGADVRRALLGRPARFSEKPADDEFAEARLGAAAKLAGFSQIEFCPEPTAAAHDFREKLDQPKLVLIADFGGGTSDFSIVRLGPDGFSPSDVLGTGGITIAGDALDGRLMRHKLALHFGAGVRYRAALGSRILSMPEPLLQLLSSPAEMSLLQKRDVLSFLRDIKAGSLSQKDQDAIDRLLCIAEDALGFQVFEAIEATKRTLSEKLEATFRFDYPGINLSERVSRDDFERVTEVSVSAIVNAMDRTLGEAGVRAEAIELVCLTGGTAKVPRIYDALRQRFSERRLHRLRGFHAVAEGLAQAARKRLLAGA